MSKCLQRMRSSTVLSRPTLSFNPTFNFYFQTLEFLCPCVQYLLSGALFQVCKRIISQYSGAQEGPKHSRPARPRPPPGSRCPSTSSPRCPSGLRYKNLLLKLLQVFTAHPTHQHVVHHATPALPAPQAFSHHHVPHAPANLFHFAHHGPAIDPNLHHPALHHTAHAPLAPVCTYTF